MAYGPVRLLAAALFLSSLSAHAADPVRVTPADPSPLANTAGVIERQFSPLEAYQLERKLRTMGVTNALDVNDLSAERLLVRSPEKPASDGRYGLLVYLGPWKQARFDAEWNNVLDSHSVVFVSPDNAGDDTSALERRIPLALHAYEYARNAYKLDPERVYVVGLEGGSRLANGLAVTYPEIFSGAIVNSGSLEMGTQALPAPGPEALQQLRTHSRFAFATGAWDQPAFSEQQRALSSLRAYCVPTAHVFDMTERGHTDTGQGHAPLSGRLLGNILQALDAPRGNEQAPSAREETLRRTASVALDGVRQLNASGDRSGALKALVAFDHAYGRLMSDEEFALARELNPAFFDGSGSGAPARSQQGR